MFIKDEDITIKDITATSIDGGKKINISWKPVANDFIVKSPFNYTVKYKVSN